MVYEKRNHALFGERLALDLDNAFYMVAEGLVNSFREQEDFQAFKLSVIVNFSLETAIPEEEFLKDSVNDLTERLYQEAVTNYRSKMEDMSETAVPVFKNIRATQGSNVENVVVPFTTDARASRFWPTCPRRLNQMVESWRVR